jgi:hypothetical protein
MAVCLRCGYEWTPRKENPKKCPSCQNPGWNTPRTRRRRVVIPRVESRPEVVPVTAEGVRPVPEEAKTGSGEFDRIKRARERAERMLEVLNGTYIVSSLGDK